MYRLLYAFGLVVAFASGYWLKPGANSSPPPPPPSESAAPAQEAPAPVAQAGPAPEPKEEQPVATPQGEDTEARLRRIAEAYASSSDVTTLSERDLSVQSHKWDQKILQVDLNCFYADANEFRCTGPQSRVDFVHLYPDAERKALERDCDTLDKAQTRKCRRTLRFTYEGFHDMEVGGFVGKITVAVAGLHLGAIMPPPPPARKKR